MKYGKAHSLRRQQAIARYGKSARHPLCLAALGLWRLDEELSVWTKKVGLREELLKRAKQLKQEVQVMIGQFRREQQEKEANEASAFLSKIDEHLLETQTCYQAAVKVRSILQSLCGVPIARFELKRDAARRTGNVKARRALQRARKRWNDTKAFLGDGDRRTLEMLKMLSDEVRKAAWAKGGAKAGFIESARGGDRALSDETWQGLLTAREIQSLLVDAPGDRHAKEVRRLARKLGIRLAEDQRGRKRNPYLSKREPNRPRGRPRAKPDIGFTNDLEVREAMKVAAATGKTPVRGADY
jgi:hypothetical protein